VEIEEGRVGGDGGNEGYRRRKEGRERFLWPNQTASYATTKSREGEKV